MRTLTVSGIGKTYGRYTALQDVSIALKPGEIHGLLGPNGSGKTTTLHVISGLIPPSTGTVYVSGIPIEDKNSRKYFGFAPDDLPLPSSLTGNEFLHFHDSMRAMDNSDNARILVESLGLSDSLNKPIAHYSHGMKRKIQLVAALSHKPKLLILDEPFRGLDPEASSILVSLLNIFTTSGGSVLIATHDMLRAQRDCDVVTIINEGCVITQGAPKYLIEKFHGAKTLEDVFMNVTGFKEENSIRQKNLSSLFM